MVIKVNRKTLVWSLETELMLQLTGKGNVIFSREYIQIETNEFIEFLRIMSRVWRELSRYSYPEAMRCKIEILVNERKGFVKYDEELKGIRYGGL